MFNPSLQIPNLAHIYLIGFYKEREFAIYVSSISNELIDVSIECIVTRYLKEDKPHGSAGGLNNLEAHRRYGGMGTILVSKVSAETTNEFRELVTDLVTNELLHYTKKSETFVSDNVNCGVCVFTPNIFNAIQGVSTRRKDRGWSMHHNYRTKLSSITDTRSETDTVEGNHLTDMP
ncbi:hypothetical protein BC332_30674 [Capsicum chinense]|nr:hypothetical protein BC332_30674 [Capsicum chinense]